MRAAGLLRTSARQAPRASRSGGSRRLRAPARPGAMRPSATRPRFHRAAGRSPARTRRWQRRLRTGRARRGPQGARRAARPVAGPPCRASSARRPRSRGHRRRRASGRAAIAHRAGSRRPRARAAATAAGSKAMPSAPRMCWSRDAISAAGRRFRLNCRQRDSTVTGSFCGSVVASRNLTCGGGSSSVFSRALKECVDSMCTSSIRYTLNRPRVGRYCTFSRSSRVSSTLVREAASTSIRSTKRPSSISRQAPHSPQGVGTHAPFAVERPGEDPCDRRLADAARAREKEGMVDAARIQGVHERLANVLLADQLGEIPGAPLAGEYEVAHRILFRRPAIIAHPRAVGGGPRQHPSGTRCHRYRCSLPGLAGFTADRRGGTDASHHGKPGPGIVRSPPQSVNRAAPRAAARASRPFQRPVRSRYQCVRHGCRVSP